MNKTRSNPLPPTTEPLSADKFKPGAGATGQLRAAQKNDIPAMVALINANLDKLLERSPAELETLLETTWVVEESQKIVGCVCLEIYSKKIAELRTLAVSYEFRGKGYGILLVKKVTEEAKKRGIPELLTVSSSKEFFERLNFGPCLNEKFALFWRG